MIHVSSFEFHRVFKIYPIVFVLVSIKLSTAHNLLPAHAKLKYDLQAPSNCVTRETPFNEPHLWFECKNLQLQETT